MVSWWARRKLTNLLVDKKVKEAIDYVANNMHKFFSDVKKGEKGSRSMKRSMAALYIEDILKNIKK